MLLKKKKLSDPNTVVIRITPTPYTHKDFSKDFTPPYSKPFDKKAVCGFYYWLLKNSPDAGMTRYQIAEALDVHAIVVDEWLMATNELYLTFAKAKFTAKDGTLVYFIPDRRYRLEAKAFMDKKIKIKACTDYDPWTDREWDTHFKNTWQPYFIDTVIDKYYSVFTDEVLIATGKRRAGFTPLIHKRREHDHPINFKEEKESKLCQKNGRPNPPPLTRKKEIKELCGSQKQGEYLSWMPADFFGDTVTRGVQQSTRRSKEPAKTIKGKFKKRRIASND